MTDAARHATLSEAARDLLPHDGVSLRSLAEPRGVRPSEIPSPERLALSALEKQNESLAALVEQARADSEASRRESRFSRRVAVCALAVSILSVLMSVLPYLVGIALA